VSIACISTASAAAYGQQRQNTNPMGAGSQSAVAQATAATPSGIGLQSGSTQQSGQVAHDHVGGAVDASRGTAIDASHAGTAADASRGSAMMDGTSTLNTLV
jgi:hypothetical protein